MESGHRRKVRSRCPSDRAFAMAICAGGFKKNQPVAERSSAACHATSLPSQSNVMHLGLGANSDINIFRFRAMRC